MDEGIKKIALFGCEESQECTKAFLNKGWDAYSCDLQPSSGLFPNKHIRDDIFHVLHDPLFLFGLEFFGAHPPCDYLANSGVCWLTSKKPKKGYEWSEKYQIFMNMDRYQLMVDGALFFKSLLANLKRIGKGYIENPIMHKYAMEIIGEPPTQIIQPYMFGHPERKATCLWIEGLPKLQDTNNVYEEMMRLPKKEAQRIHYTSPGPNRKKIRSKTFPNIAQAMAAQWSDIKTQSQPYTLNLF